MAIWSWSSGVIGLFYILHTHPDAHVHVFGMNWESPAESFGHPFELERQIVQQLIDTGHVTVHQAIEGYHARVEVDGVEWLLAHRCGEWTPWWFPIGEWQHITHKVVSRWKNLQGKMFSLLC